MQQIAQFAIKKQEFRAANNLDGSEDQLTKNQRVVNGIFQFQQ